VRNAECGMRNEGTAFEPPPTNRQPVLPLRTPNSALRTLFVSQRDDRIERRRAPRRPDAEEQSHRGAEHEGEQDGERRDERIPVRDRSEEHTSELQSPCNLVCRLLLEKKKTSPTRPHDSLSRDDSLARQSDGEYSNAMLVTLFT